MSEANNNFSELKQLLKLKRHEVPPPGYFNHFSDDVIARIREGETGGAEGFLARLESGSLLGGLLQLFQAKPGVIGGFATSLCLLLLIGVVMADRPDGPAMPVGLNGLASNQGAAPTVATYLAPSGNSGISISTNPVVSMQPSATLFGGPQNPLFQPAAFMTSSQ